MSSLSSSSFSIFYQPPMTTIDHITAAPMASPEESVLALLEEEEVLSAGAGAGASLGESV